MSEHDWADRLAKQIYNTWSQGATLKAAQIIREAFAARAAGYRLVKECKGCNGKGASVSPIGYFKHCETCSGRGVLEVGE